MSNALSPRVWGPSAWETLHSISFGYPVSPTKEQEQSYKAFFQLVGSVLPCARCRSSYADLVSFGGTKITDKSMSSRDSLTEWLFSVHRAVNKRLESQNNASLDEVRMRYESVRSNGYLPVDSLPLSRAAGLSTISQKLSGRFVGYAKLRGISKSYIKLHDKLRDSENATAWKGRDVICKKVITDTAGRSRTEASGPWRGFPSVTETKLILLRYSSLGGKDLAEILSSPGFPP